MYRNHTQSKVVTLLFRTTLTGVQMSMKYLKTPSVQDFHSALHICSFIIYPKIYNTAAHMCHRSQSEQFSSLKMEMCSNADSPLGTASPLNANDCLLLKTEQCLPGPQAYTAGTLGVTEQIERP